MMKPNAFPITSDPDTGEEIPAVSEEQLPYEYELAIDEMVTGGFLYMRFLRATTTFPSPHRILIRTELQETPILYILRRRGSRR